MSWLYLPGWVEAFWPRGGCLGGGPSVTLSETHGVFVFCGSGSSTAYSTMLRSGAMLERSTGVPGLDVWISSLRDFRVSRGVWLGGGVGLKTIGTSGLTPFASLVRSDRSGFYWRMSQGCLALTGISDAYSGTWPRAGMMRGGTVYRLPPSVPRTAVTGYGLWPTPTAGEWKRRRHASGGPTLHQAVCEAEGRGGGLNPEWVEWLMGWPIGHTACAPLGRGRFRRWLRAFGGC